MSVWVLLWLTVVPGGATSGTMMFATQAACEAAADPFLRAAEGPARDGFAACVEDPEPQWVEP